MKNPQTCLSVELLRKLSHNELSPAELMDVEDHVSDCERCRQLLEVPQSDPQWQDEIVPILRTPLESRHVASDQDERSSEDESLESILRLLGPTDDPHMLGRIGSYEVVGVIGRGGMGVVFKAYEGALNRFVAIKMLLPHLAASGAARKRFAREGQAAAAVIDDNVMPIYSVAEWQGVPYLVTQYSRGATLQKRLQDQGPLELKEILRIGMQTARGLAAAHAQGLVHRDVKPSNILLDGTVERALLTDFGLARAVDDASITRTGIIAGTPQYMSPEQARGGSVDARSDLFGLGCVLYAMCTGRPPFRAESSYAILRMITDDEPRSIREINPDIPEWLCLLISRLMAKSPEARSENALEVAALLEQCLAHVQQPTSTPLPASLAPRAAGRRSIFNVTRKGAFAMLGILGMIGTIGMTLLGMVLWLAPEAPDISGQWTSEEWGTVILEAKQPGEYEGTFTGSGKGKSGTVQLKWSRVERRFSGAWKKDVNPTSLSSEIQSKELISSTRDAAVDRSGAMSLRLVENEIRGGWTTDEDAQLESGTPLLGDLLWKRSVVAVPDGGAVLLGGPKTTSEAALPPVIERPKLPETGAEGKLPPAGAGIRVNVPALGPAPLAFDFAFPGSPVHPKLAIDSYAKSGVPLAEQTWPMPPWGEEKGGLSAGIRILGDARIGGEVKAELWVRNSGAKDVTFSQCPRADVGLALVAKDKDGKEHSADITQFRGRPIFSHWLLPPGHIVKVKEFTLKLGSRKNDELERGWVSLDLPPGDYKLRAKWRDSHALVTHAGDWTGELITGEVDLNIAAADASADAAKPAAEPPGTAKVEGPVQREPVGPPAHDPVAHTEDAQSEAAVAPGWVVAWDFNYTLLHQRYAMMRISSDGKMEALFPGWRLLRTQLSPDELAALVALVAKNPNVQSRSMSKVAEYSKAVAPKPELVDSINKVNVRSEMVAVVHQGELLELDLDTSESAVVTNQLWKLVGLAAIGGPAKLPQFVDAANSELKRRYPDVSQRIDQSHFRFAIVDYPSGNISVWFNFNVDSVSKDGQVVLRIPQDGLPSIEQVVTAHGESPHDGAEKPTARATPKLPKLPDEAYTTTGIHRLKFHEEDVKRPGAGVMSDVVEAQHGKDPLVLGMRVASDAKWNIGGHARVELVVRNASASDVKFQQTHRADNGLSVVAIDKNGNEHHAEIAQFDSWLFWNSLLLPPSHVVMVKSFTLRFDPEQRGASEYGVAAFHLPPGDYTLRCTWSDARPEVAHEGEWTGELVSVEHPFTLPHPPQLRSSEHTTAPFLESFR